MMLMLSRWTHTHAVDEKSFEIAKKVVIQDSDLIFAGFNKQHFKHPDPGTKINH